MNRPGSALWFAHHELRLAWRDWRDMMTANGRRSLFRAFAVLAIVGLIFHLPVYALVQGMGLAGAEPSAQSLMVTTFMLGLFASLLAAQAMESVTRSLYTRGDLDLVVSSPIDLTRLYAVRLAANAVPIVILAVLLSMPLVNVLIMVGGARWIAGFAVALAFGVAAAAVATLIVMGLFRVLGPRRTRLVAQVVAAVVGAAFAIGIQVLAIVYYGTISSGSVFMSPELLAAMPSASSLFWLPARAAFGDPVAIVAVLVAALLLMVVVVWSIAPHLASFSLAANDLAEERQRVRARRRGVATTPAKALRRKEWALLQRDPWLVSQTLTQMFYLLPPALLLTHSLGGGHHAHVVVVMVLVTVGGQLAGALAWLAISGEDAPGLVATAPVGQRLVIRAKIEAVLSVVAILVLPLTALLALVAPFHALVAAAGVLIAALSTIMIQLWFRSQAQRSNFRRRHTSSRIATFAEALVSFSWAAAAGLATSMNWFALASVVIALLILAGARSVSPRQAFA